MSYRIAAVYEHGVLRPLMPLNLQEHQQVQVEIVVEEPQETVAQIVEQLICAGRITPPHRPEEMEPLSALERAELAKMLGKATSVPLSQIILDERE